MPRVEPVCCTVALRGCPGGRVGDVEDHRLVGLHIVQIDVFTIFPGLVDDVLRRESARQGPVEPAARSAHARPARAHHRRASHRRRFTVRRRCRDGDEGRSRSSPRSKLPNPCRPLYLLGPGGRRFDQADGARTGHACDGFSLLCGRYEGVDHRVREHLVDGELSIGDVVLGGGEVAACLVIEAVVRLLPGAMGNDVSPVTESFGASGSAGGAALHPPGRVPWAGRCPTRCAAATTPGSSAGDVPRPCTARSATGLTWSRRPVGSAKLTVDCWKSSLPSPILDRSLAAGQPPSSTYPAESFVP